MTAVGVPRLIISETTTRARSTFWRRWLFDTPEAVGLAIAMFGVYVVAGWVLRYHFGYIVNDALARTAKPVFMALSRDPHFGAVGFYWPPLPSTLQIPFVILLWPFGHMDFAGPTSSALWGSVAVPVLARICREQGWGRVATFVVCLLFACNPAVFVYAVNGMSESCQYMFLLIVMLGWLRWVRRRGVADIALMSIAMAAAVMVRIESLPVVVVIAVLVGVGRDWRAWVMRATTVAAAPVFVFLCWLGTQWILLGDPLAFLHYGTDQNGMRRTAGFLKSFALPRASGNYFAALPWAAVWVAVLSPMLIALLLCGIIGPRRHLYAAAGIVGSAAVFPLVQVYLIVHDTGFGDPRYFTSLVPLAFVSLAWLGGALTREPPTAMPVFGDLRSSREPRTASRRWSAVWRSSVRVALVMSLAGSGVATLLYMLNGNRTRIGNEHYVYQIALGRPVKLEHPIDDSRRIAEYLDPYLGRGEHAILDTSYEYAPILFSHHPKGFIIQEDRDFRPILDSPEGRFQFVLVSANPRLRNPGTPDLLTPLVTPSSAWRLVRSYGDLRLYRFIGQP